MASLNHRFRELFRELQKKYRINSFFSRVISALEHVEVEFNPEIPTARVIRQGWSKVVKIELSPKFFENYCVTAEDLLFVLSHEALHYIAGHLSWEAKSLVSRFGAFIANVAMDVVINQLLYRYLPPTSLHSILRSAGGQGYGCPLSLLLPLRTSEVASERRGDCRQWLEFLKKYHQGSAPLAIFYSIFPLAEHIAEVHFPNGSPLAFLDLVETIDRDAGRNDPVYGHIVDAMKGIFGTDLGKERYEEVSKAKIKLKEDLLQAIKEAAEDEEGGIEDISRGGGVLPFYDRKDFLFLSTGIPTVLFHANPAPEESRGIRLYVDVSDSMRDDLPHVFYALDAIKEWIVFPIYGFSTEVFPITRKELLRGRYLTTLGTDYNCIARHLTIGYFRNAIVVTDGHGYMHPIYIEYVKRNCHILTILVGWDESAVRQFSQRVIKFEPGKRR